MKMDDGMMQALVKAAARPLTAEQVAYLGESILWYNSKVYKDSRKADHNPAELLLCEDGYYVQHAQSKHVRSPGEWMHFHCDSLRAALGDREAAQRVREVRDTMELLQSST